MTKTTRPARRRNARQKLAHLGSVLLVVTAFVVPSAGIALGYASSLSAAQSLVPDAKPFLTEVSLGEYEDSRDVNLTLAWVDGPQLLSPGWAGVVTQVALKPEQVLTTGDNVVQVDGVWRIAAYTTQPFYSLVVPESDPSEVERLNTMLTSLGLSAGPGQTWTWDTTKGIRQLGEKIEVPAASDLNAFDPAWIVWLPAPSVTLSLVDIRVGMAAPTQGEGFAETAPMLASVLPAEEDGVVLPDPGDGEEWVYQMGDVEIAFTGGLQSDAQQIAPLAATLAASKPETARAALLRREPFTGWEVPTSAVYVDAQETTCVFTADRPSGYAAQVVEIASGAVGVTRVRGELPGHASLLTNPAEVLVDASCN